MEPLVNKFKANGDEVFAYDRIASDTEVVAYVVFAHHADNGLSVSVRDKLNPAYEMRVPIRALFNAFVRPTPSQMQWLQDFQKEVNAWKRRKAESGIGPTAIELSAEERLARMTLQADVDARLKPKELLEEFDQAHRAAPAPATVEAPLPPTAPSDPPRAKRPYTRRKKTRKKAARRKASSPNMIVHDPVQTTTEP
jgi:hypothetical protein